MSGYSDRPLAGVGGWLTFFLVVIGILSPLRILFEIVSLHADPQVAAAFGDIWAIIIPIEWGLAAIQVGICWFMAWRLLNVETWQTVRIVIAGIWIAGLGVPALEFAAVALIAAVPIDQMMTGASTELVRALIFSGIWTAYFLRSERVANTYLRPGHDDRVAEVFS
jgi:hypothetical protein